MSPLRTPVSEPVSKVDSGPGGASEPASKPRTTWTGRLIKAAPLIAPALTLVGTMLTAYLTYVVASRKNQFDESFAVRKADAETTLQLREQLRKERADAEADRQALTKQLIQVLEATTPRNLEVAWITEPKIAFALATRPTADPESLNVASGWISAGLPRPRVLDLDMPGACRRQLGLLSQDLDVKNRDTELNLALYGEIVNQAAPSLVSTLRPEALAGGILDAIAKAAPRAGDPDRDVENARLAKQVREATTPIFPAPQLRRTISNGAKLVDGLLRNTSLLSPTDQAELTNGAKRLAEMAEKLAAAKPNDAKSVNETAGDLIALFAQYLPSIVRAKSDWSSIVTSAQSFQAEALKQLNAFEAGGRVDPARLTAPFDALSTACLSRNSPLANLTLARARFVRNALATLAEAR